MGNVPPDQWISHVMQFNKTVICFSITVHVNNLCSVAGASKPGVGARWPAAPPIFLGVGFHLVPRRIVPTPL
jgi:hypothetical protein